ncbi:hypothetical protein, partial [Streptomyces rubiginosohelvolus]
MVDHAGQANRTVAQRRHWYIRNPLKITDAKDGAPVSEFGEEGVHGVLFDFAGTLFDDTGVLTAPRLVAKASGRGITLDEQVAARLIRRTLAYVDAPERSAAKEGCDLSPDAHKRIWTG